MYGSLVSSSSETTSSPTLSSPLMMLDRRMYLEHEATGNPNGPTVYFLHGWPDNLNLYKPHVEALKEQFYCVRIGLPGFGSASPANWPARGEDIALVTRRVAALIDVINEQRKSSLSMSNLSMSTGGSKGPYLVGHDWGAVISYELMTDFPRLIKKAIILDIGGIFKPSCAVGCGMCCYQWFLITAWCLPDWCCGNTLTRCAAGVLNAPIDEPNNYGQIITNEMNWPYYHTWKRRCCCLGRLGYMESFTSTVPILFMYGKDKKMMFHSPEWIDLLGRRPGSLVQPVDGDHWFFIKGNEGVLITAVQSFFTD